MDKECLHRLMEVAAHKCDGTVVESLVHRMYEMGESLDTNASSHKRFVFFALKQKIATIDNSELELDELVPVLDDLYHQYSQAALPQVSYEEWLTERLRLIMQAAIAGLTHIVKETSFTYSDYIKGLEKKFLNLCGNYRTPTEISFMQAAKEHLEIIRSHGKLDRDKAKFLSALFPFARFKRDLISFVHAVEVAALGPVDEIDKRIQIEYEEKVSTSEQRCVFEHDWGDEEAVQWPTSRPIHIRRQTHATPRHFEHDKYEPDEEETRPDSGSESEQVNVLVPKRQRYVSTQQQEASKRQKKVVDEPVPSVLELQKAMNRMVVVNNEMPDPLNDAIAPVSRPVSHLATKNIPLEETKSAEQIPFSSSSDEEDNADKTYRHRLSMASTPVHFLKKGAVRARESEEKGTKRVKWTEEEEEMLRIGMFKFGSLKNKWATIRRNFNFGERTAVHLKDKWRIMEKHGITAPRSTPVSVAAPGHTRHIEEEGLEEPELNADEELDDPDAESEDANADEEMEEQEPAE